LLIRKLGYERWKQLKDTGRRWITEIVFSSLKRVLGEADVCVPNQSRSCIAVWDMGLKEKFYQTIQIIHKLVTQKVITRWYEQVRFFYLLSTWSEAKVTTIFIS
jgi:hypothetical protein